jgi:hypothetical protein
VGNIKQATTLFVYTSKIFAKSSFKMGYTSKDPLVPDTTVKSGLGPTQIHTIKET